MTPTKALHDKKLELKKGKLAVCSNVTCAFKPLPNGNVSFVVWWHNWARTFYIDNLSPSQALAILAALNGALCHKCLGVAEQDLLEDIQHAAFMTVVCARLRNHGKEIPPANLEPVKHGLIVAQELMEYAYEHERQALINVLKHNTHENIAENPGLHEAHERFILGKHYDTVRRWGLEDDSLEKAMKSGVLPEPEERNDYLEQRGGER